MARATGKGDKKDEVTKEALANVGFGHEYDVFKDSPLRYLGYANEVGEAFRPLILVQAVWASYAVASSYVLADAIHKGYRTSEKLFLTQEAKRKSVVIAFTDTLIWQGFASVIIPGFTINRICFATGLFLKRFSFLPVPLRKWGTTFVGLACIPFIIHPIDRGVDHVMDQTLREWYNYHPRKRE